jgi:hypothetical protein
MTKIVKLTKRLGKLGTIALVTLLRSSEDEETSPGELIVQIRKAIQSSKILNGWTVEKISILGSKIDPEIAPKVLGEAELKAVGVPPVEKKTPSYGD